MKASASAARRSAGQIAAYALPAAPLAIVVFPSHAILPGFYAQHTQIPLATIGIILMLARVFDAVVDPLIGYASDAAIGRWKSRKPWLAAGALLLAVSAVQLYGPAPTVGAAYYLGWFLALYLGYSLIEIPYKAWGTELAHDYVDRARIATGLALAFGVGNLVFALAPLILSGGTRGYDAQTLAVVGWGIALLLPASVAWAMWRVPSAAPAGMRRIDLRATFEAVRRNRLLQRYAVMFLLTGLGQGVFYGLVFLYVGPVLGLGASFAWVLLADALVTLLGVPVWYRLVRRLQKHRAWALGLVVSAAALLGMMAVPVGEDGLALLLALVCLRAFGSCVTQVAPNALLGDVVDYESYKRRVNQAANFHALVSLIAKFTTTVGGGAGLLAVGLAGFDPKAANPPQVLAAFKVAALLCPALILLAGAAATATFPLGQRGHDAIRRRLERRGRDEPGPA